MRSRIVSMILLAALLAVTSIGSFAYAADNTHGNVITNRNKKYHILFVGNSFNWDTAHYVHNVARATGYKVDVGICYRGGSSVITHYRYCSGEKPYLLKYKEHNRDGITKWKKLTFGQVLDRHRWDAVVFQMTTGVWYSGKTEPGIDRYVVKMADIVRTHCAERGNPVPVFGANMTWSYDDGFSKRACFEKSWNSQSAAMYEDLMAVRKEEISDMDGISFFIPTATAVQNARTTYIKPGVTRDGQHMSLGHGRFLAAVCAAGSLGIDIDDVHSINYDMAAGRVSSVHDWMLKRMAKAALAKPFAVTDFSKYNVRPAIGKVRLHAKRSLVRKAGRRYTNYKLAWNAVPHATGYSIYYKKKGASRFRFLKTIDGNAGRKAKLKRRSAGSHYYFRVYAVGDSLTERSSVTVYR